MIILIRVDYNKSDKIPLPPKKSVPIQNIKKKT